MNKNELLRELQELDFAIQEAVLFLDTHPRSEVALSYYRYVTGLRRKAAEEYRYGIHSTKNHPRRRPAAQPRQPRTPLGLGQ